MKVSKFAAGAILLLFFILSCGDQPKSNKPTTVVEPVAKDSITDEPEKTQEAEEEEEPFVLTEDNAIDFFFEYQKDLKENKVKLNDFIWQFYRSIV